MSFCTTIQRSLLGLKFPAPLYPFQRRSVSGFSTALSRLLSESFSSTYPPAERKSCSSSSDEKNITENSKVCLQVLPTQKSYHTDHMSSETGSVNYVFVNRATLCEECTHISMTSCLIAPRPRFRCN